MLLTSGFVNLTGTVIRLVSGRSSDRSRQAALSIIPAQPGNVAHTSGRPDKRQSAIQSAMLLMNWLLVPAAAVAVWLWKALWGGIMVADAELSEVEISRRANVSRVTVRKALGK